MKRYFFSAVLGLFLITAPHFRTTSATVELAEHEDEPFSITALLEGLRSYAEGENSLVN